LRVDRRHPWLLDAALVFALLAMGSPPLVRGDPRWPVVLAFQVGLILPLTLRRRVPTLAFVAVVLVFLLQSTLGIWQHTDITLLIALYSVARHGKQRDLPWVTGVAFGALLIAALRVAAVVSPLAALFFLGSAGTAAITLGLAIRTGRAYLVALRERATRLEIEQEQRSRLAAASERARVTREVHDIIGHNLSVIIGLADGGAYAAEVSPERSGEALRLIASTGRQALGELRRVLGVLREDEAAVPAAVSPQPGIADLDALADRIRVAGPEVVYRSRGDLDALDRGLQLTIYRIAQESLTNVLRYAGADTRVWLTLTSHHDAVCVRVEDTGPAGGVPRRAMVAMPDDTHAPGHGIKGHGIRGMRERAAMYGGSVTAGPRPGGGWLVEAILDPAPLPSPVGGAS
jgi:signal transduction histidine kinase